MELYTHTELDDIAAAPKRHHVYALVKEVKRLSAISQRAEQLLATKSPPTRELLESALRQALESRRGQFPFIG